MVIKRYILREVSAALLVVTGVLLLLFLSNQFIRYLSKAASGGLPLGDIFELMGLMVPQLLGLLLPLGLFFAILLALGRLYADHEMTVLSACGYSTGQLVGTIVTFGVMLAVFVGTLTLFVSPRIAQLQQQLLHRQGTAFLLHLISPGHFQRLGRNGQVVYVQDLVKKGEDLRGIFAAKPIQKTKPQRWEIIKAAEGQVQTQEAFNAEYFVARQGARYAGAPGQADFRVTAFDRYGVQLTSAGPLQSTDTRAMPTAKLWQQRHQPKFAAELQWRLSIPIMVILFAFLAVPLGVIKPRQGKYAKLLPATLIAIFYANMVIIARNWISQGDLSPTLGVWWLHGFVLLIALGLLTSQRYSKRFFNL